MTVQLGRVHTSINGFPDNPAPEIIAKLQLDDNYVPGPFTIISGTITLRSQFHNICCEGIRVQLDATLDLDFKTRPLIFTETHTKVEGLLQGSVGPTHGTGDYICSPIRQQIFGRGGPPCAPSVTYLKPSVSYSVPFQLTMPEEPLPAPFNNENGRLKYHIAVYVKAEDQRHRYRKRVRRYVDLARKSLIFDGYNNLSQHPDSISLFRPFNQQSHFPKSANFITATASLVLNKTGFLPGEEVLFELTLFNINYCIVNTLNLSLVRRVVYNSSRATKVTTDILESYQTKGMTRAKNVAWSGKLRIPRDEPPTYDVKPVYNVIHLVQYEITMTTGVIEDEVRIVIGTTNQSVQDLKQNAEFEPYELKTGTVPLQNDEEQRERSTSIVSSSSLMSDSDMSGGSSLPDPEYTEIPSREMSLMSFESTAPNDEDLL